MTKKASYSTFLLSFFLYMLLIFFASSARAERLPPRWLQPLPCSDTYAHPLPGQPTLGLSLFRFDCPNQPPKLISAHLSERFDLFQTPQALLKGNTPQGQPAGSIIVDRPSDLPLSLDQLPQVQARRALPEGSPLYVRDFEPRLLWIGGTPIQVRLLQGGIKATLPATSLSTGRYGQPAQAKSEQGLVFHGKALVDQDGPYLEIRP